MNSASEPKERSSLTSALPASSRRPATTTFAPFLAKATAAARPMPVRAPVIKTTDLFIALLLTLTDAYNFFDNSELYIDTLFPVPATVGFRSALEKDFVS